MKSTHAPVAQLDRALVFGPIGCGFDYPTKKIINFASIVKWISHKSSELRFRVRALTGAP